MLHLADLPKILRSFFWSNGTMNWEGGTMSWMRLDYIPPVDVSVSIPIGDETGPPTEFRSSILRKLRPRTPSRESTAWRATIVAKEQQSSCRGKDLEVRKPKSGPRTSHAVSRGATCLFLSACVSWPQWPLWLFIIIGTVPWCEKGPLPRIRLPVWLGLRMAMFEFRFFGSQFEVHGEREDIIFHGGELLVFKRV